MATTTVPTIPTAPTILPTPAPAVAPGYKSTEFWFALAAKLLGGLFATGLLADGSEAYRIAGLAAVVLSSLGYSVSRGLTKGGAGASQNSVSVISQPGFASLPMMAMLAIAGLAFACLAGCGARMKTAETTAIDCAKADVVAAVPSLLPTVESVLAAPSTLAAALVNALLNVVAPDVLACTVKAAEAAFAAPKVGDPIGVSSSSTGLANAHSAMAAHGWTYKP